MPDVREAVQRMDAYATAPSSPLLRAPNDFWAADAGTIRFPQRRLYIANALVHQHIGLEETDDRV